MIAESFWVLCISATIGIGLSLTLKTNQFSRWFYLVALAILAALVDPWFWLIALALVPALVLQPREAATTRPAPRAVRFLIAATLLGAWVFFVLPVSGDLFPTRPLDVEARGVSAAQLWKDLTSSPRALWILPIAILSLAGLIAHAVQAHKRKSGAAP